MSHTDTSPLLGTSPQEFNPNSLPFNDPGVTRKVAIVTGGNSGLGFYTALHLYIHGCVVYIAARNPTKATDAIAKIKNEAAKRKGILPETAVFGELHFFQLDLASLAQTQKSATEFLAKETQLDILVNNAGVMALPIELTEDKLDIQIQTNHISPFLFTIKVLPLLQKSEHGPRIVFVSSLGHTITDNPENLDKLYSYIPSAISGWLRYGNSKLANILTAKAFAVRYPSILSVSVHPGLCMQTNLMEYWRNIPCVGSIVGFLLDSLADHAGISNEAGAYNSLFTSLSPALTTESNNGQYFFPVGVETKPSSTASDPEKMQHTWDWTITQLEDRGFLTEEEVKKFHS